jgi:DNA 3'-phosphatase
MNRTISTLAASFVFAGLAYGCSTPEIGTDVGFHGSCEGAKLDDNGKCRRPNGWYAHAVCCEAPVEELPAYPSERRNLEAYACPEGVDAVKVAFFDADSTLRISRSGYFTAKEQDDVYILPFVATSLKQLNDDGYLVVAVSNQGGVAAGLTPIEVAEGALVFVAQQLDALGAKISYLDFADQKDEFRKPKTGMADLLHEKLQEKCTLEIDWDNSFMVGDAGYKKDVDGPHPDGRPADDFSNSDRLFAENLGIPFSEPTDYFGWNQWKTYNLRFESQLLALLGAMDDEIDELDESGDDDERLEALRAEVTSNRAINDLDAVE